LSGWSDTTLPRSKRKKEEEEDEKETAASHLSHLNLSTHKQSAHAMVKVNVVSRQRFFEAQTEGRHKLSTHTHLALAST
jgi:hypothetical protein